MTGSLTINMLFKCANKIGAKMGFGHGLSKSVYCSVIEMNK